VYSKGIAQYYDLFADAEANLPAAAFVRACLPQGGSILDIGAGTGTLALALAGKGYAVTALEPDAEMHAALLVRLASHKALQQSFTPVPKPLGFPLHQKFDACLALAVMHLLDAPDRALLYRYAAAHLQEGGRFIAEIPVDTPQREELPHQLKAERTSGGTRYQHSYSMHRTTGGRWHTTWEFLAWRGDELLDRRTRTFDWKPASTSEVVTLAAAAGLVMQAAYADFDRSPFIEGDSRVLVAVFAPG
jgi:SAM-dependent methyltransferase